MNGLNLEHVYVAIIAGGAGTRLFPYSNPERPKQFCKLNEKGETFIQNVIANFTKIGINKNHFVVITTNKTQTDLAKAQVVPKGVLSQNIHEIKPGLDYGGAMIEATKFVKSIDEEAIVINTPSDQYVEVDEDYRQTIYNAIKTASQGEPVIVGVKVSDLVVVMGCGNAIYKNTGELCFPVESFIEKPKEKEATNIMRAGNSACSTGISIWQIKSFFRTIPEDVTSKVATNDLMKQFKNLKIAVGDFKWYDCGTLFALYEVSRKTPNHKNASFGGGEIDRFKCLNSLFLCDEGYRLHAAGCRDVAVIVTTKDGRPTVAVNGFNQNAELKELAENFPQNEQLLKQAFSIKAHNNNVVLSNISEETITIFVGVDNYTISSHLNSDGVIDVQVSGKL